LSFSFSSLLVVAANDLPGHREFDLGGLNLSYLVFTSFVAAHNLPSCDLHVDNCLPFPPS